MPKTTCIQNVNVITMTDETVLANQDVVIKDGKIISIKPTSSSSEADEIIDGTDKYLMPGLFDSHAHMDNGFAPLMLMNGITAVRDCGNDDTIYDLRSSKLASETPSPRLFISGNILEGDPPMWPESKAIKNIAEADAAISELQKNKVDQIKLYHTLPPKIYEHLIKQTRKAALPVAGHIPEDVSPIEAYSWGLNCIEHIMTLGQLIGRYDYEEETRPEYEGWYKFTNPRIDKKSLKQLTDAMDKNDTYLCPTLIVHKQMADLADFGKLTKDPNLKYINSEIITTKWNPDSQESYVNIRGTKPLFFQNYGVILENLRTALPVIAKHATILAGSDAPNPFVIPGFSLLDELELLTDSGLSNFQILQSATVNPAKFFNVGETLGEVKVGADASLILLDANPLKEISNIRKLDGVFINNTYFTKESIVTRAKPVG